MKRTVNKPQPGRLDSYVATHYPEINRSFAGKLCDDEKVLVNNTPKPASYRVKPGDTIELLIDTNSLKDIPTIDLPVLYEDDDVIVIDKPSGILTHSKGSYNPEATVASFIAPKVRGFESSKRDGIVHRIDRATSGVIICAKHPEALTFLQKQFSNRKTKKKYLAIIEGTLSPSEAEIDMPIARNPKSPKTFHVSKQGKSAHTHYKVQQSNKTHSIIELTPTTGRTHQLRVHLKKLGHPIVGDTFYDGPTYPRLLLHAWKLGITIPDGTKHEFVAQIPKNFHTIMND